jgi:hypothetical protein
LFGRTYGAQFFRLFRSEIFVCSELHLRPILPPFSETMTLVAGPCDLAMIAKIGSRRIKRPQSAINLIVDKTAELEQLFRKRSFSWRYRLKMLVTGLRGLWKMLAIDPIAWPVA